MSLRTPSSGVVAHRAAARSPAPSAPSPSASGPFATACFARRPRRALMRARDAEQAAREWRRRSQHDPLTGVGNYRKLHESLHAATAQDPRSLRAADARRRPLQGDQRGPRPPGGRPPAPGGRPGAGRERPRDRRRGPPGRRRVLGPAARGRRGRRDDARRSASRRRWRRSRRPTTRRCARRSASRCSRRTAPRRTTCWRRPTSTCA